MRLAVFHVCLNHEFLFLVGFWWPFQPSSHSANYWNELQNASRTVKLCAETLNKETVNKNGPSLFIFQQPNGAQSKAECQTDKGIFILTVIKY